MATYPIETEIRRIDEPVIRCHADGLGAMAEFRNAEELLEPCGPGSVFSIPRAALELAWPSGEGAAAAQDACGAGRRAGDSLPGGVAGRLGPGDEQHSGRHGDPRAGGDLGPRSGRSCSFAGGDATGAAHDHRRRLAGSGGRHLSRRQAADHRARLAAANSRAAGAVERCAPSRVLPAHGALQYRHSEGGQGSVAAGGLALPGAGDGNDSGAAQHQDAGRGDVATRWPRAIGSIWASCWTGTGN